MFILYFASPELPKVPVSDYFEDPEHRKTSFGFSVKTAETVILWFASDQFPSALNPSGLQNWRSLFFFYKTLELAKEWALLDFGIGEEWGTLELVKPDYTIRRFVGSSVFPLFSYRFKFKCIQLENFEEVKRYSLNSFRYWISVRFRYSKDLKWQSGSVTPSFQMVSLNLGI
ncbi:uncharacterized protein OCT59_010337 [Rhizophagus irregularis]|uniref:uncharacterized protein n=1 Tax=Rhizophagus irregularis TaxID=588596 RepID=UPI003318D97B|nr:hypothetical protein OCT59_010337 [Rhizophagus irregularis]